MIISREPGSTPYSRRWSVWVYSSPDLMKPKEGIDSPYVVTGDNPENTKYHTIQIQQLNANRILITPKEGLFEKGRQYFVQGWGDRFFTQDKLVAPDLPITKDVVNNFSDDFTPIEGKYGPELVEAIYIDWVGEDDKTNELLSAQLIYRKETIETDIEKRKTVLDELGNKYINFLLSHGYTKSEKNSYVDESVSVANPWRTKKVTGLQKDQTVCKVIIDNGRVTPTIYCSTLPN